MNLAISTRTDLDWQFITILNVWTYSNQPEHVDVFAKLWYLANHAHHLEPGGEAGEAGRVERPTGQRELLLRWKKGMVPLLRCIQSRKTNGAVRTSSEVQNGDSSKRKTRRCTTVRDSEGQAIPCNGRSDGSVWMMGKWSTQCVIG